MYYILSDIIIIIITEITVDNYQAHYEISQPAVAILYLFPLPTGGNGYKVQGRPLP